MVTLLSKVKDILIGKDVNNKYTWVGIIDVQWNESETWCKLPIPKGSMVFQDILPYVIEGVITCIDYSSMQTALFNTNIDASNNKAIVTATMRKRKVDYFVIEAYDKDKSAKNYKLTNFRVKSIDIVDLRNTVSANPVKFLVHFYADLVAY